MIMQLNRTIIQIRILKDFSSGNIILSNNDYFRNINIRMKVKFSKALFYTF